MDRLALSLGIVGMLASHAIPLDLLHRLAFDAQGRDQREDPGLWMARWFAVHPVVARSAFGRALALRRQGMPHTRGRGARRRTDPARDAR